MKNIKIVIGANFGDEGKGLMTNYFAKNSDCIVVLSNGGAQRGHTVSKPDGTRHVFHHFGSGTFNGASTYFPKEFILNPIIFRQEYEELLNMGYIPTVYGGAGCMTTTPWDMLANQIIESSRGKDKHGSCGMGIYETIQRENLGVKSDDYEGILSYYNARFEELEIHLSSKQQELFCSKGLLEHYKEDVKFMKRHVQPLTDNDLDSFQTIVFENAQGLMLDQNNMDYFPHLTPSNTGIKNPKTIIERVEWTEPLDIEVCYVTRTYLTRHGAGYLPRECKKEDINPDMIDETNVPNPHQDSLRYGMLDLCELYERCMNDLAGWKVKKSFAITHNNEFSLGELDISSFDDAILDDFLKTTTYLSENCFEVSLDNCGDMIYLWMREWASDIKIGERLECSTEKEKTTIK